MTNRTSSDWLLAAKRALEPYFDSLDDAETRIVDIRRTVRPRDDEAEKIERAEALMSAAASGMHPKRAPLTARLEEDGSYTILDGRSTHANLENLGMVAVPVVLVEAE